MPLADILPPTEKPVFATVTLRMTPAAKDLLNKLADKHNRTQGEIVEALLWQEKKAK